MAQSRSHCVFSIVRGQRSALVLVHLDEKYFCYARVKWQGRRVEVHPTVAKKNLVNSHKRVGGFATARAARRYFQAALCQFTYEPSPSAIDGRCGSKRPAAAATQTRFGTVKKMKRWAYGHVVGAAIADENQVRFRVGS